MMPARSSTVTPTFALLLAWFTSPSAATAQGPTIDLPSPERGRAESTRLGPLPGSSESSIPADRPGFEGILGGRAGTSVPRVPFSATTPGGGFSRPSTGGITPPGELSSVGLPLYGSLSLPPGPEPEGLPGALSLDDAIDQLILVNPDLQALQFEIPQARADIVTAGLRANPILYADAQLIPYGSYSDERPGGPVQYDLNITYPLDISGKRRARIRYANRVLETIEAQYQDAVRLMIDNLYTAFVDVLAAREAVRLAGAAVEGLAQVVELSESLRKQGALTEADVNRVRIQLGSAEVALADAEETRRRAGRTLGALLGLHPAHGERIEVQGSLHDPIPSPPTIEELTELALRARSDLITYRLGIRRADAQVDLELANRFSDIFVLYQPYTYQDLSPFDVRSATSWALGVTVPLPVYNRNQGNIERARLNVGQTRAELQALERQVVVETRQAEREYYLSREALRRIEADLLPRAQQVLDNSALLLESGEVDAVTYLNARRDYNDVIRQYLELLVRHRRSMLDLNTAVGYRILP